MRKMTSLFPQIFRLQHFVVVVTLAVRLPTMLLGITMIWTHEPSKIVRSSANANLNNGKRDMRMKMLIRDWSGDEKKRQLRNRSERNGSGF